jgi:choline dehydrogenase-like flavoprotein
MKTLVIGTGAAGAMVARHLALTGNEVRVMEAGQPFKPLTRKIMHAGPLRRVGLLGSERTISRFFPYMRTTRSGEVVTVRGLCAGGCTVLSCGNMVPSERGLREIGLDLGPEFQEIGSMLPICTIPRERWRPTTRDMFDVAARMGLSPSPTPKAVDPRKCVGCGMCELGCSTGARWDSRVWLNDAVKLGTEVLFDQQVGQVIVENGKTVGVRSTGPSGEMTFKADRVVLAAGGIGTAQILKRSGIEVEDKLWVDPVITFGGTLSGSRQLEEMPMAWYCRKERYMISPYLDILSHFFQPSWRKVGLVDRVGVMIKLADDSVGSVDADGDVCKSLTQNDEANIAEASAIVEKIMSDAGVRGPLEKGMINGGHLGGVCPLHPEDVSNMRPCNLPDGLWVADLSLAPKSQGGPTMMLAAALGLRVGKSMNDLECKH